jgi:hypothetical protein
MLPLSLVTLALMQTPVQDCPPVIPSAPAILARTPTVDHPDESESFNFVFAWEGGGGGSAKGVSSVFGGLKIGFECCIKGTHPYETGRTITLDIGYDRIAEHDGLSTELSVMLPVVRFPQPRTTTANYLRVYAEPGVGVRAGERPGIHASAKVLVAFLSDERIFNFKGSPFVEIQGRIMAPAPHRREVRILAGVIIGLCRHCGLD